MGGGVAEEVEEDEEGEEEEGVAEETGRFAETVEDVEVV